jgi:hypothetical protein
MTFQIESLGRRTLRFSEPDNERGVIGYDKIKPKAEELLKVVDIFDF